MFEDKAAGEISLSHYLQLLKNAGRSMILGAVLFTLLGAVYLHVAPRQYRAEMVIAPNSEADEGTSFGLSAPTGFSGFLGMRSDRVTDMVRFEYFLGSERLAQRLESKYHLIQRLKIGVWDPKRKEWREPTGFGFRIINGLKQLIGLPGWTPPTYETLASYLADNIEIKKDPNNGIRTLTYYNKNPRLAVWILSLVQQQADNIIRAAARESLTEQAGYLEKKLPSIQLEQIKVVFAGMLESRERALLLALMRRSYAIDVLQPAVASARPVRPNGMITIAGALVLGLCFGFAASVLGLSGRLAQFWVYLRGQGFSSRIGSFVTATQSKPSADDS